MFLSPLKEFPNSGNEPFIITSPQDKRYNCIAWAYGRSDVKMWPAKYYYWPEGLPRIESIQSFIDAFSQLGYIKCEDSSFESGFLKVALFANNNQPKHAAKQLDTGFWSSKLGDEHDVTHSIESMEGGVYGTSLIFMKRPK